MTLAHSGHWYHSLLYLLPVLLIAGALWWSGRKAAKEARPGEDSCDEPAGDDAARY